MEFRFRRASGNEFVLPLNPQAIDVEIAGRSATYESIDLGTIQDFRGKEAVRLSWQGLFPGRSISQHSYLNGPWVDPYVLADTFREIAESNERIHLLVSETFLSLYVKVPRFKPKIGMGSGHIDYTLELVEARELRVLTDAELGITGGAVPSPTVTGIGAGAGGQARPSPSTPFTILTKTGDTFWLLAARHLGAGSKWTIIFNANQDVLKTLPDWKNGTLYFTATYRLPAGLTLRIPGGHADVGDYGPQPEFPEGG